MLLNTINIDTMLSDIPVIVTQPEMPAAASYTLYYFLESLTTELCFYSQAEIEV